ncbi:MAG: recombination regulator RecX [Curvibacter sp. GWA2_64_110]|nr:MAG: recombination regulator RecX [Curvibacter sp. GWA2_64_110]HCY16025.1 recombination regulator RecX [Curvibacter sp.]
MAFDQPSLKGRALRLLSTREHSRAELERKLVRFEQAPGELTQALDELQAKGFISEQRVVESVLHRRAAKLGAARIRQELQDKGLDRALVEQALAGLKDSELVRAREVWCRKYDAAPANPAERARQQRFLLTRGFSAEVVRQVLVGAGAQDDE